MKFLVKLCMTVGLMLMVCMLTACGGDDDTFRWEGGDTFVYQGEKYISVDLSKDIFFCDVNRVASHDAQVQDEEEDLAWYPAYDVDDAEEEGEILYAAESGLGETLYYNGTFYCREDSKDAVTTYYHDDENFDWFIETETEDTTLAMPFSTTEAERDWIYGLEKMTKEKSIFLDEAEGQGSLVRASKDGLIGGRISLLRYEGEWYWQTETIDEHRERDGDWPEYIQPLPKSLSEKIEEVYEEMKKLSR